jgi:hypothetical protein
VYNYGSLDVLSVETAASGGNCQIFRSKFLADVSVVSIPYLLRYNDNLFSCSQNYVE